MPDERFILTDYSARSAAGKVAHRPTSTSNCVNEYASLIIYPVNNSTAGLDPAALLEGDLTD